MPEAEMMIMEDGSSFRAFDSSTVLIRWTNSRMYILVLLLASSSVAWS